MVTQPMNQKRYILVYAILILFSIITLVPFAYLGCGALKSDADFFAALFLPAGDGLFGIAWDRLTLDHFRRLHSELGFTGNLLNSFFLASVTSVLATLCSAMGGYALAKFRFRGDGVILFCMFTALVIPAALLLAPSYQLLYWFRLLDTYPGLIVPAVAPAFGIYLFRQATLNTVPSQMIEAARIDGCGEVSLFFTIVLPMVRPMIGAFLIITYLGTWNSFIWPQIVLQSPERFPLAVAVAQLRGIYAQDYGLIMAGTLVSIAPVLILFLLLQREFISGLTAGAVKG